MAAFRPIPPGACVRLGWETAYNLAAGSGACRCVPPRGGRSLFRNLRRFGSCQSRPDGPAEDEVSRDT